MKMYKALFLLILLGFFNEVSAQFLKPFDSVSKKKTSYLTLVDGTEVEGNIKKLRYGKKALIKEVIMKVDGKKQAFKMEDIKHAYFPQSAFDKFLKFEDYVYDATQWDSSLYSSERLKEGYAYYESIDIILKGDERKLLMQLLNPFPNNRIKVYHDPAAKEKGGFGIGGLKVVKSQESNYYVSKDGEIAKRLRDKDYKKRFDKLLGDCRKIDKKYGDKKSWKKFEEAVMEYNESCPKE